MDIVDFSSSEGDMGARIRFDEAPEGLQKELEGAESKLREKKSSKKRPREPQEGSDRSLAAAEDRLGSLTELQK